MIKKYFLFSFILIGSLHSFKIDRVILATDLHENYLEFWPLVAKMWQEIVGVKPTLAFIAPSCFAIDESVGEVIRFEPLPGIPTSFQAQVIRLLLPALFEQDVSIISDIDMIPLNKWYFTDAVALFSKDYFIVYRDKAYGRNSKQYPMCYNAAAGKLFKEIFHVASMQDIQAIIRKWFSYNLGWSTDEQMLYKYLHEWSGFNTCCMRLGHDVERRVDRIAWQYNTESVAKNYYIDAHLLRPYHVYHQEIDRLISYITLDNNVPEQLSIDKKTVYRMLYPKKRDKQ